MESASAYSTVAKWHAEFTQGQSSCDDSHRCGQLASSIKKLFKNSTTLSRVIDDCQLVSSLHLLAGLSKV